MSIKQRDGIWHIDITTPSGARIRRSTRTKNEKLALELHDKVKHEAWKYDQLEEIPRKLWDEAALRWLQEMKHKKSLNMDKFRLRKLLGLRGRYIDELTKDSINAVINNIEGISDSTKNRYLALIRAILRKCEREWDWLKKAPTLKQYQEPKRRIRWITKDEARKLINSLPDLYADLAQFSLMTGLRQQNVLQLSWHQVNLDLKVAWVDPEDSKSGRAIGVPLNDSALSVLNKHKGRHDKYVFISERFNQPLKRISQKVWDAALDKSEINNLRWHDLRHTWASWLIQSGVDIYTLQELGGWESIEMVKKYAHLSPTHLLSHASKIDL